MLARDNPFSTHRVENILSFDPQLSGTSWEEIERRWIALGMRASLVAPHGAGKSTFMDAFQERLETSGHSVLRLFLNQQSNKLEGEQWNLLEQCQQQIVMLDGEEQLGYLSRSRFYQLTENCSGLLITRHKPAKLPQLFSLDPDIQILTTCVERLAPEHLSQLQPMLSGWWREYDGNIREILLRCYDSVQNLK